jgi:hypothetical protein
VDMVVDRWSNGVLAIIYTRKRCRIPLLVDKSNVKA